MIKDALKWYHQNQAQYPAHGASVDVWQTSLSLSDGEVEYCEGLLNPAERERAAAFRLSTDRNRYIAAHGQLRMLLGRYLVVDPADLVFGEGKWGKPHLVDGVEMGPRFNISLSEDLALVAISDNLEMGIDIECVDGRTHPLEFSESFLTAAEREFVDSLPPAQRPMRLYQLWTAKEAFLKALGTGFQVDCLNLEVHLPKVAGNAIHFKHLEFGQFIENEFVGFSLDCGSRFSAVVVIPCGRVIQRGMATLDEAMAGMER